MTIVVMAMVAVSVVAWGTGGPLPSSSTHAAVDADQDVSPTDRPADPGSPVSDGSATGLGSVATGEVEQAPSSPAEPGRESARLADLQAAEVVAPTRLRMPALGVDAPILPVGARDGAFDVVDDVDNVGWYRHGPAPGADGSAVLAAHVDLAGAGPGVFFHLDRLEPGDMIEVAMDDGSNRQFEVETATRYPKEDLPVHDVFARDGDPRLTLVTCGGAFDQSSRSYEDNVVVVATPAG